MIKITYRPRPEKTLLRAEGHMPTSEIERMQLALADQQILEIRREIRRLTRRIRMEMKNGNDTRRDLERLHVANDVLNTAERLRAMIVERLRTTGCLDD